ncbi:MAG: PAS domain S-box protein [Chloroflexota bacterium]
MAADRAEALVSLAAAKEKYQDLVENINDVIFTVDVDKVITYVSSPIEAISGYEPEEIIGRPFSEFVHPDDLDSFVANFENNLAGKNSPHEFRGLFKDGRVRWIYTRSKPLVEDGKVVGVLGTLIDITERKQLEAQLRQAQKMEALGHLTGGIAHDFNNLLTVITTYNDLALRVSDPANEQLHRYLAQIKNTGKQAASFIQQLLAFSRQQILKSEPLDLNSILEENEDLLKRLAGSTVQVALKLEPSLGIIQTDKSQIHQVLLNLIANGRDAMPKGGDLVIETANVFLDEAYTAKHPEVKAGHYVLLSVTDTGLGIDEDTLPHIFDPFFTTKELGSGTGLGLATIHGIVKQCGGHIWVYSEVGKGTSFKIYFPQQ